MDQCTIASFKGILLQQNLGIHCEDRNKGWKETGNGQGKCIACEVKNEVRLRKF